MSQKQESPGFSRGECQFAAFPAAHDGMFYLWGDDSNYVNVCDVEAVERAYRTARLERFGR